MLLARPVVAASSVKVTEPGECTTSVRSLAARSTACVPLGLVTVFPACALPPSASVAVAAVLALDSSILQNHVLLCDATDGPWKGQAGAAGARPGGTNEVAMFVNTMPRYEILSADAIGVLDRGWRRIVSEIGIQFAKPEACLLYTSPSPRDS